MLRRSHPRRSFHDKRIGGLPWLLSRFPIRLVTGKQIRAIRPIRDDLHALLAVVEERLGASIMLLASSGHPYRVPFEMKAAPLWGCTAGL